MTARATRDPIEFASLCEPAARRLWGEPNAMLSKGNDLRWGAHGSRSIDLRRGLWFDHEAGIGGGTIDLICHALDCDKPAALSWLMREGLAAGAADPARQALRQTLREVAAYDYTDEAGVLLYQVVRYEPKAFRQRQRNSVGG
jgi:putative DNA primase/helicase